MSNFSVNSAQGANPAAQAQQAKLTKGQLKDPKELFKQAPAQPAAQAMSTPDQSQAKSPPAGGAVQKVSIVDTPKSKLLDPEDVKWFSELTQKANTGYQPTEAEVARYQKIMQAIQVRQQELAAANGVKPEDMTWASELEAKAAQGYKATPEEVSRYKGILEKITPPELTQPVTKPTEQPAPQPAQPAPQPVQQPAQPQPQPAQPTQPAPAPTQPSTPQPVADQSAKFKELDQLLSQKQYILVGAPANLEAVRQTAVQIWLDGGPADKLKVAQKLVENGQAELLGRVLNHVETNDLEAAQLMTHKDFPIAKYMQGLNDNQAFSMLRSLTTVALTGEKSSIAALEKSVKAFEGRVWDREKPFEQLKAHLQTNKDWDKLPAELRTKIDKLLD